MLFVKVRIERDDNLSESERRSSARDLLLGAGIGRRGRHGRRGFALHQTATHAVHVQVFVTGDEQLVVGAQRLHGVHQQQTVDGQAHRRFARPPRIIRLNSAHLHHFIEINSLNHQNEVLT